MIVWTEPAVADLEAIRAYIARDNEVYADAVLLRILESVDRLESYPRLGRVVPELGDDSLRELIVGSYRVMYEVSAAAVVIQTVLHGARAFPEDLRD